MVEDNYVTEDKSISVEEDNTYYTQLDENTVEEEVSVSDVEDKVANMFDNSSSTYEEEVCEYSCCWKLNF